MRGETRRQLIGLAGLFALALGAAVLFSPRAVIVRLEALASRPHLFVPALAALYLVRPFLLWPVTSVAVLLGYLYGPPAGFVLALSGAAVTALPPYFLGRYADTELGLFATVSNGSDIFFDAVGDFRGTIAARFSPVPGDPISYAAGLSGVSVAPFLAGTVVGEIPWAFVAVFAGASMRTLRLSAFAISPELVVAISGLGLLVLARPVYNRLADGTLSDQ